MKKLVLTVATLVAAFGLFFVRTAYADAAQIKGKVMEDMNGNGIVEAQDTPLAGWTVELLSHQGSVIDTTTSNGAGDFSFPTPAIPGTYYLRQQVPADWTQTIGSNHFEISVPFLATQDITTGVTNHPLVFSNYQDATVHVCMKITNGGTAANITFTNNIDGQVVSHKPTIGNSLYCADMQFGNTHFNSVTIIQDHVPSIIPNSYTCVAPLSSGGEVTCMFVNQVVFARINIQIQTLGGEGTFTVFGVPAFAIQHITTTNGYGSATVFVTEGQTALQEVVPTGWTLTQNTCQLVTLAPGQTTTCFLTNVKKPTLTINTVINNYSVGTKTSADFHITLDGSPVLLNTTQFTSQGSHVIAQDSDPNYTQEISSGCDTPFVLLPGENKVCTITNTIRSLNFSFLFPYSTTTNSYKKQSSIPVKVKLTLPNGGVALEQTPEIFLVDSFGNMLPGKSSNPSITGNIMQFDNLNQAYAFDLSTKNMVGLGSYSVLVKTNDGQTHSAKIIN